VADAEKLSSDINLPQNFHQNSVLFFKKIIALYHMKKKLYFSTAQA